MRPSEPVAQQRNRHNIDKPQADKTTKIAFTDLGVIGGSALACLTGLIILARLYVNKESILVPFVVAAALPLFTLFAIIYQAVVYRRQWRAMEQALGQTEQVIGQMQAQLAASEKQALIMEGSLDATQKLVEHSEKQARIMEGSLDATQKLVEHSEASMRAYVTVTKREPSATGFTLTIENSGNTPAIEVAVETVTNADFTPPALPKEASLEGYTHIGLLAPHASYELPVPFSRNLTEEERTYFEDPTKGFDWWCTGRITYKDIFQTQDREYNETYFCFYHDRTRRKIQAYVTGNEMKAHRPQQKAH